MKSNYLSLLYPFWLLMIYAMVRLFLSLGSISTGYVPSAVISFKMVIHTFVSFVCVSIFMAGALWLSQYIGKMILFGDHAPRRPQTFVLLIFTRYILYLGFLQYLLLNMLPGMNGIIALQIIIYNIFAGLMLIDYTIYWLELPPDQAVRIKLFRWQFQLLIIQVYRLQVYIMIILTLILLCRYFVTCHLQMAYMPIAYMGY